MLSAPLLAHRKPNMTWQGRYRSGWPCHWNLGTWSYASAPVPSCETTATSNWKTSLNDNEQYWTSLNIIFPAAIRSNIPATIKVSEIQKPAVGISGRCFVSAQNKWSGPCQSTKVQGLLRAILDGSERMLRWPFGKFWEPGSETWQIWQWEVVGYTAYLPDPCQIQQGSLQISSTSYASLDVLSLGGLYCIVLVLHRCLMWTPSSQQNCNHGNSWSNLGPSSPSSPWGKQPGASGKNQHPTHAIC